MDLNDLMRFHEKLANFLATEPGWDQARIVRMTGLAQSAVSEIVNGKRRPYLDQAWRIANAIGLSLDFLADDAADAPARPYSVEEQAVVGAFRGSGLTIEDVVGLFLSARRPANKNKHLRS